jgi:hypothetical protein
MAFWPLIKAIELHIPISYHVSPAKLLKLTNKSKFWSICGANGGADRGAKKPDFSGFFSIDKLVSVCDLSVF